MTGPQTTATVLRAADAGRSGEPGNAGGPSGDAGAVGWLLLRSVLSMVAICCVALLTDLVVLGALQHQSAQHGLRDRLRIELANGVAPVQAVDPVSGSVLVDGSPLGILQIPDIDVDEVVLFGTTSPVLKDGVGLRRDTPFPGQHGTTVLLGRAAAYGGPFGSIDQLVVGSSITVTTGQGAQHFAVVAVRRAGDPLPPAAVSGSRLTLVTATGSAFLPSGVLRVDADLVGSVQPTAPALTAAAIGPAEHALAGDSADVGTLVFALQALLAAVVATLVAWRRWGRLQAWVVGGPVVLLAALWAADQATSLLPNLT